MSIDDATGAPDPAVAGEAPARSKGHPLLATIIGCGLILLSARPHPSAPADRAEMLAEIFGFFVAGVVIVWGIAWLVTIRRSSWKWHAASLAAIGLTSLLASLYSVGSGVGIADRDIADTAHQMQAFAGGQPLRVGANSGPVLRMSAVMFNGVMADSSSFKSEADAAGLAKIMSFDGLTPQSPILSNCGRLDSLAGRARAVGARWNVHLAAAHVVGEQAVRDDRMSPNQLQDFETGVQRSEPAFRRMWELNGALATQTAGLCRLLHARPWRLTGGKAIFSSRQDLAAFREGAARLDAIIAEQTRLRQAEQAQSDGAGKGLGL